MWVFWDRPMAEPWPENPFRMEGIMREGTEYPAPPNGAKPPTPVVPPSARRPRVGEYVTDGKVPPMPPPTEPPPRYQAALSDEQLASLERSYWPLDGSYLYRLALLRVEFGRVGDALVRALGILAVLTWLNKKLKPGVKLHARFGVTVRSAEPLPHFTRPPHADTPIVDVTFCPGPASREDCEHPGQGQYHRDGTPCRGWRHWMHV